MHGTREKLIELLRNMPIPEITVFGQRCGKALVTAEFIANHLIAHGVTVQDDMTELIGRGLDNIYWRIYGANKEFNERMAGYNQSGFCAGFEYAIQLAKGLLTQLPQPPKGE